MNTVLKDIGRVYVVWNMPDRATLIRRLSFAAYFIAAFFLFLFLLFPFDRVKSKLEAEIRMRTPWS